MPSLFSSSALVAAEENIPLLAAFGGLAFLETDKKWRYRRSAGRMPRSARKFPVSPLFVRLWKLQQLSQNGVDTLRAGEVFQPNARDFQNRWRSYIVSS
jgi:hypothetical protein